MIRKGFYFSSKTEKNKGDRDFKKPFRKVDKLYKRITHHTRKNHEMV